jgi:DNA-binding NtrC family response regulator
MEAIGKILIIDDEKINAEVIKDILEDVNYEVFLALGALEAKALVLDQTFDLIIMDVWMPGQDGMSLLEEWQKNRLTVPIIMMSGHAQHQDVVRAIKLGAQDFLQKPLHDILPIVRKVLSKQTTSTIIKINPYDFNAPLKIARHDFEVQYFNFHLENNSHNIAKVADIVGMERTTLYRKLKDLGIDKK